MRTTPLISLPLPLPTCTHVTRRGKQARITRRPRASRRRLQHLAPSPTLASQSRVPFQFHLRGGWCIKRYFSASWRPSHRHRPPPNGAATPPRDRERRDLLGTGLRRRFSVLLERGQRFWLRRRRGEEWPDGAGSFWAPTSDGNGVFRFLDWRDGDHQFSLSGRSFREIWEDVAREENS